MGSLGQDGGQTEVQPILEAATVILDQCGWITGPDKGGDSAGALGIPRTVPIDDERKRVGEIEPSGRGFSA